MSKNCPKNYVPDFTKNPITKEQIQRLDLIFGDLHYISTTLWKKGSQHSFVFLGRNGWEVSKHQNFEVSFFNCSIKSPNFTQNHVLKSKSVGNFIFSQIRTIKDPVLAIGDQNYWPFDSLVEQTIQFGGVWRTLKAIWRDLEGGWRGLEEFGGVAGS